jgi:hypothetical protein
VSRNALRCCTTALLGGSLALTVPPPAAFADQQVPAPIQNADLAVPELSEGVVKTKPPEQWSAEQTQLLAADVADHPDSLQAVTLNYINPGSLTTRLWRVQKGSRVTVTWDDSPSTLKTCKPDDLTDGQNYTVSVAEPATNEPQTYTTNSTEKGKSNWQRDRTYTFTAAENNPKITFTSEETRRASKCGPLLTGFSATQLPAPVPYDVHKTRLPMPQAYKRHDVLKPELATADCNRGPNACRFEKDARYSYRYYDRPRTVGQVYINCTRNAITETRTVSWQEHPYDNLTQYYATELDEPLTPDRARLDKSYQNVSEQIEAGFTRADGNPREMATTNPLLWEREEPRKLSVTVQPGEVSWIEVQPARERIAGTLVNEKETQRLDITVDVPSGSLGDRFYQRTGPLSKVELNRCGDDRDNVRTPDNTIGAPTLRSMAPDAGLVPLENVTPADFPTVRSVPLTPGGDAPADRR